jgi:hypothetical protein
MNQKEHPPAPCGSGVKAQSRYRDRLAAVGATLDALEQQAQELGDRLAGLKQAGAAYGRLFWDRAPRGPEKSVLKLAHSRHSPGRPANKKGHEYIAKEPGPEQIAAAEAKLERGHEYRRLLRDQAALEAHLVAIGRQLEALEQAVGAAGQN